MNFSEIIWNIFQSKLYHMGVLPRITWFSILLRKTGDSAAVYTVSSVPNSCI